MRQKSVVIVLLFFLTIGPAMAQDSAVVEAFQKNFTRGSLSTKIQVLQDSASLESENMSPLYLQAMKFVIDNSEQLKTDSLARELTVLSVRLVGMRGYQEAAFDLWQLFSIFEDTGVRVEIMNALGKTAVENTRVSTYIINWLSSMNTIYASGGWVDKQVLAEAVVTLGRLGRSDSFPVVFAALTAGYSDDISDKAALALKSLQGNYAAMLKDVIETSSLPQKLEALKMALEDPALAETEKGELSEVALEYGLSLSPSGPAEQETARQLRYHAVRGLAAAKWTEASAKVIKHFDTTLLEYDRGITRKENLLEAISALGSMGNHEAAVRLTLYLELLNSYTENGQVVDEQIILAVISNLGRLGDIVAFDYLLYTGYLNYAAPVKKAAREAIEQLKRT
ncbi:MAG: hypothetical protein JW760_08665 [Spirochaetales bacterium]|nr:hypothetical protein [Spirochaetales bacterium]